MKKSRYTKEQIIFALKPTELDTSEPDVYHKQSISDAMFYTWLKRTESAFDRGGREAGVQTSFPVATENR
ncbi:Uncharacterised protein [Edwardsiella hoshinae]|uniref:Transposase n=1 Tax=Edwardsiella hoshinae TaxID=93378 RepID=A0A376D939_9GAMM|nr:Uncharacterised protein [Edwardsiella hoshinae]